MTAQSFQQFDPDLSDREQAILSDLARARIFAGKALERVHFADLPSPHTRANVRWRVMKRLVGLGLVTTLDRRIGGVRAGSAGLIYTLDAAGLRRAALIDGRGRERIRRPWSIGPMFVAHTLDVGELYVRLREAERAGQLRLLTYETEPKSWHRAGYVMVKPDAYAAWQTPAWEEHRWIEVDRATESLPTLRRKLLGYIDAATSGDLGPRGVLPRVLVTVPNAKRLTDIRALVEALPAPGLSLIEVELFGTALRFGEPPERPPP